MTGDDRRSDQLCMAGLTMQIGWSDRHCMAGLTDPRQELGGTLQLIQRPN